MCSAKHVTSWPEACVLEPLTASVPVPGPPSCAQCQPGRPFAGTRGILRPLSPYHRRQTQDVCWWALGESIMPIQTFTLTLFLLCKAVKNVVVSAQVLTCDLETCSHPELFTLLFASFITRKKTHSVYISHLEQPQRRIALYKHNYSVAYSITRELWLW